MRVRPNIEAASIRDPAQSGNRIPKALICLLTRLVSANYQARIYTK